MSLNNPKLYDVETKPPTILENTASTYKSMAESMRSSFCSQSENRLISDQLRRASFILEEQKKKEAPKLGQVLQRMRSQQARMFDSKPVK